LIEPVHGQQWNCILKTSSCKLLISCFKSQILHFMYKNIFPILTKEHKFVQLYYTYKTQYYILKLSWGLNACLCFSIKVVVIKLILLPSNHTVHLYRYYDHLWCHRICRDLHGLAAKFIDCVLVTDPSLLLIWSWYFRHFIIFRQIVSNTSVTILVGRQYMILGSLCRCGSCCN
jgi:hypothetical protein